MAGTNVAQTPQKLLWTPWSLTFVEIFRGPRTSVLGDFHVGVAKRAARIINVSTTRLGYRVTWLRLLSPCCSTSVVMPVRLSVQIMMLMPQYKSLSNQFLGQQRCRSSHRSKQVLSTHRILSCDSALLALSCLSFFLVSIQGAPRCLMSGEIQHCLQCLFGPTLTLTNLYVIPSIMEVESHYA